jgi:hypothetical protein
LEGLFKEVLYVKQTSDLNFVLATDLRANVSNDSMELKDRFIKSGISEQYSVFREYIDSNNALVSDSFGIMDDLGSGFYNHSNILRIALIFCFMIFIIILLLNRFQVSPKILSTINTLLWSIFVGSLFGSMVLYRQKFFIDAYSTFNFMLSVFFLGIIFGTAIASRFMSLNLTSKKIFKILLTISTLVVLLCLSFFINLLGFSIYLPYVFLLLAGGLFPLIFFTQYWYRVSFSLDNLHSLCAVCFFGFGIAFFIFGVFENINFSFTAIAYLLAVYCGLFILYNFVSERRTR